MKGLIYTMVGAAIMALHYAFGGREGSYCRFKWCKKCAWWRKYSHDTPPDGNS